MGTWSFKALRINSDGKIKLVKLSSQQQKKIDAYTRALEVAAQSVVAHPPFSNYFVKESIGFFGAKMIPAGNIEYGLCQALHGEEVAIAAFRAHYGGITVYRKIVLGIIAGSPGNIPSPCGNCRDILLEEFSTDFEIVSGAAEGGVAVVTNIKHYLFSDFYEQAVTDLSPDIVQNINRTISQGEHLVNDAYSPSNIHPERKYHALIATPKRTFIGARDIMCEYHPIYALRDAIRQARRANNPFVESVVIVCEDTGNRAPHVMYKDRQHLFELNLQAELVTGKENDPPVFLVTYDSQKRIKSLWQTSVKEWLPFPFSPRNFGPGFVAYLTNYFQTLKRS